MRRILLCAFTALLGCAHMPGLPLDAMLARVDVARLLECGTHAPDWQSVGRCLGFEAMNQGLQIATQKALEAAERAREAGHGGGAEVPERDRQRLAVELDRALDDLALAAVQAR